MVAAGPIVNEREPLTWQGFWNSFQGSLPIAAAESADFVERLSRLGLLVAHARVLDFGCGFGFVAGMLAGRTGQVAIWDAARPMLEQARERLRSTGAISIVDLSDAASDPRGAFDLIVVNSVVQYMTEPELARWLERWSSMLAPRGRIVVSDVPVRSDLIHDTFDFVWFSLRRRLLLQALRLWWREFNRLATTSGSRPRLLLPPAVWQSHARKAGLDMDVLPENLTLHRSRMSVVFQHRDTT
jgi:SAM-dependent methyltransferase